MTIKKYGLIVALLLALPASAELYRWVDAQGNVHYSDTPQAGAEQVELKRTNVIKSQRSATSRRSGSSRAADSADSADSEDGTAEPFEGYQSAIITSPTVDQTLWNIGGQLTVSVSTEPGLQPDHGLVIYLDGKAINDPVASTSLTIGDVYRGTHSVRAAIMSADGKVLINGPTTTFHVRQSSIAN